MASVGFLKPTWFVEDAAPVEIESVILCNSQDGSIDKEDSNKVRCYWLHKDAKYHLYAYFEPLHMPR